MTAPVTSRARGPSPIAPAVEDRIQLIVGLMSRFEWVPGVTDEELAEEWGVDARTVRHSSAEASRIIRREVATNEVLSAEIVQGLRGALQKALQDGTDGRKVVAGLGKALADITGVTASTKHEVSVQVLLAALPTLPPPARVELLSAVVAASTPAELAAAIEAPRVLALVRARLEERWPEAARDVGEWMREVDGEGGDQ